MNLNGQEYYYIRNAQNDIISLNNSRGTTVATYTYDSWGKLLSIKDENGTDVTNAKDHVGYKNPYRYRGYRYDTETGLYYLNSRYYNSEWGRFVNADATGGKIGEITSHNVFEYCDNSPVNMCDQSGNWAIPLRIRVPIIVGIIAITALKVIRAVIRTLFEEVSYAKPMIKSVARTKEVATTQKKKKDNPKAKYWRANYNTRTKKVDIGSSLSEREAYLRVENKKSIICRDARSAQRIAYRFKFHKVEIDEGKLNVEGYYPHYHVTEKHGDPHIWYFPQGSILPML